MILKFEKSCYQNLLNKGKKRVMNTNNYHQCFFFANFSWSYKTNCLNIINCLGNKQETFVSGWSNNNVGTAATELSTIR